MSTMVFRRPTRQTPPEMPTGELSLQEPPVLPEAPTGNLGMMLMYLPMALGSGALLMLFMSPAKGGMSMIAVGLLAMTSLTSGTWRRAGRRSAPSPGSSARRWPGGIPTRTGCGRWR